MTVTLHAPPEDRPSDAEIEGWRGVPVAIAVDLIPDAQLDRAIRPLNPPGRQPPLFGRAVTARCEPPDFGAVLHALEQTKPGDVLVIAAAGHAETAMIGGILGNHLRGRGCAGVVCDGAVRDVDELAALSDFSVFARFANPRGPTGGERGAVNATVTIGDRLVNPGDLIIGNDDGLAVLSPALLRTRLDDAKAKLALEARWIEALDSGHAVAEIFGLAPAERREKA